MQTRLTLVFPVFALLALFGCILEAQESQIGYAGLKVAKFTKDKHLDWIPPPPMAPHVPHFDIVGSEAQAVFGALNAVLSYEQLPTIGIDQEYEISTVNCSWSPGVFFGDSSDEKCSLQYRIGRHGKFTHLQVEDTEGVTVSANLFNVLKRAGAMSEANPPPRYYCNIELKNLSGNINEFHFDDYSFYRLPTPPNVTVQGGWVLPFLQVFDSIETDEKDVLSLIVCSTIDTGAPQCSYQFQQIYPKPLIPLNAELSLELWNSIKAIAKASGFEASTGVSLNEMNLLNASNFSYDGKTLGMNLFVTVPPALPTT